MQDDTEDIGGYSQYEDILNEVLSGRTEGHKCPSCGDGELQCRVDEMSVRIKCTKCGRFFQGQLA